MKIGVLFSGGKDSALAALMLARYYDVELNTFVFSADESVPAVKAAAASLGLPHTIKVFEEGLLDEAIRMLVRCGYPHDALNMVHRTAVETLSKTYPAVGDGTRWNDRVPMLARPEVQQIEALTGCSYIRPLLGFGKTEVDRLAESMLVVRYGETGTIENGDYEHEIRNAVRAKGIDLATLFPSGHRQSLVTGRRTTEQT
jgi:tRNA methyltransferase